MGNTQQSVRRGPFLKRLEGITNHIAKLYGQETPLWVSVMHGQLAEQANNLAELVKEKVKIGKLEIYESLLSWEFIQVLE